MPSASPSEAKIANAIAAFKRGFGDVQARVTVTKAGDIVIEPVAPQAQPSQEGRARQWGQW